MTSHLDFVARWNGALQGNYGTPSIALSHGEGAHVWDFTGKRYLDFLAGIATNILGHAHPEVALAIEKQSRTLNHISNFYMHEGVIKLAERLQSYTGDPSARTFFCNSGAEANEAALKLSRLTGRTRIVATDGAFHGRTLGALSLTGQPGKRDPFKPLLKGIAHVPFGDAKAMKRAVSKKTAMVIIEPILGEHGVVVPPDGYLKSLRKICDDTGTLLAIDAIQTGLGRTGNWFGYEHESITPDIITLAKGLGGGLPLGAMIALGKNAQLFKPGHHGTTFGGSPIACAAANTVLDVLERDNLALRAVAFGDRIKDRLAALEGVASIRGRGLLIGIELNGDFAKELSDELLNSGLLVNAPNPGVIRLAPALNISEENLEEFFSIFIPALARVVSK
ncbi:MAG: acetylornithine transaminase [Actinomycetes bacterium]